MDASPPFQVLGEPTLIGQGVGHCWFPALHALPSGHLLCLIPQVPDEGHGRWDSAVYLSDENGQTWRQLGQMPLGWASLPLAPDGLLILPFNLRAGDPDPRLIQGQGWQVRLGADGALQMEPQAIQIRDLPLDFHRRDDGRPVLVGSGDRAWRLPDGRWLTSLYGLPQDGDRYINLTISSRDGLDWCGQSPIAAPELLPDGCQGASETATARLPDGRLLALYRIQSGADFHLSHSADLGHTWSPPRPLAGVGSVKPQLLTLGDGTLILAGGRPGLGIWRSQDGEHWRGLDLLQVHNERVDTAQRLPPPPPLDEDPEQRSLDPSTGYLSLVHLGGRELLVAYDRLANGWEGAPGPHGETDQVFSLRLRVT